VSQDGWELVVSAMSLEAVPGGIDSTAVFLKNRPRTQVINTLNGEEI
jgi:hypothetical protein